MDIEVLKLENQLCFPLYAASRKVIREYKPLLDGIGLTYTQYITMMLLWEHETISAKKLGEYLYLDSGTLTPLLKKLEQKGLVVRSRSKQDERVMNVTLTEKGRALADDAVEIPAAIAGCLTMTQEEAMQLYELLQKILVD